MTQSESLGQNVEAAGRCTWHEPCENAAAVEAGWDEPDQMDPHSQHEFLCGDHAEFVARQFHARLGNLPPRATPDHQTGSDVEIPAAKSHGYDLLDWPVVLNGLQERVREALGAIERGRRDSTYEVPRVLNGLDKRLNELIALHLAALEATPTDPREEIADAIANALDADLTFQQIHDHVEDCLHAEHNANPEDL